MGAAQSAPHPTPDRAHLLSRSRTTIPPIAGNAHKTERNKSSPGPDFHNSFCALLIKSAQKDLRAMEGSRDPRGSRRRQHLEPRPAGEKDQEDDREKNFHGQGSGGMN